MSRGVSNAWTEKSLQKLAESVPARYDKPEETSGILSSPDTYIFATERPAPAVSGVTKTGEPGTAAPAQAEEPGSVTEPDTAAPAQAEEPGAATEPDTAAPAQGDRTGQPPIRTGEATRR
jgi:hypothetical protein